MISHKFTSYGEYKETHCCRLNILVVGTRSQRVEMYVYGVFTVASVHVGSEVYTGVSEHTACRDVCVWCVPGGQCTRGVGGLHWGE